MKRWICLPDQLNEWYGIIAPAEFYRILNSDLLPLYNYVGAPREWHIKQLPGKHSFVYTSIAIANVCYFKNYKQLIVGDKEEVFWSALDILSSINSESYHYICEGKFNFNDPERTTKLFIDKYNEFKSNIKTAFLWAEGTYLNTIDAKYFLEAFILTDTQGNMFKEMVDKLSEPTDDSTTEVQSKLYIKDELTAKEKRELGTLRNEKKKFLRAIEVATTIGTVVDSYFKNNNRPITRTIFQDLLQEHGCFDIPYTTVDKIWKSLPEKCRHKGGRPTNK